MFNLLLRFHKVVSLFEEASLSTFVFRWQFNLKGGVPDSFKTDSSEDRLSITFELPSAFEDELTYQDNEVWTVALNSPDHLFGDVDNAFDILERVAAKFKANRDEYHAALQRAKKALSTEDLKKLGIKG
jgi:hypothetical protein